MTHVEDKSLVCDMLIVTKRHAGINWGKTVVKSKSVPDA